MNQVIIGDVLLAGTLIVPGLAALIILMWVGGRRTRPPRK